MAQRIVHYLLACRMADCCPAADRQRFLAGSLLPDAYVSPKDRDKTHYRILAGTARMYDFERFRTEYRDHVLNDDLYLGYYLHLVEDAVYRHFLWSGGYERPATPEQAAQIHRDYRILNAYFIRTYDLRNELTVMPSLAGEPLSEHMRLSAEQIANELQADFTDTLTGTFRYVNEAMMEQYIARVFPICLQEMQEIRNGRFSLDPRTYAYHTETPK